MSALARYFMGRGAIVGGYDRVRTPLTEALEKEGASVHYTDDISLIPERFRNSENTIVVYTPAVPADMSELMWFREGGFEVLKRSEMLAQITRDSYVMAVAGTHGKTTTTTMTAWLNHVVTGGGSAFLGGISKNFDSNLVVGAGRRLAVEADEYDRSFLRIYADVAVITAVDADHLDIYGTLAELRRAFSQFVAQIRAGGAVVIKQGVDIEIDNLDISVYHYSAQEKADFYATNIVIGYDGHPTFDLTMPDRTIRSIRLGVVGSVNVENAVAAAALVWLAQKGEFGDDFDKKLKEGLETFAGVRRRFDIYVNTPNVLYMDDYAHHPEELRATIESVRKMFPNRRLTIAFQPHLYSRTRDFETEFAKSLSLADEVILLPIYAARELPIEGISSGELAKKITAPTTLLRDKSELVAEISRRPIDILITFGAGDIDNFCDSIAKKLGIRN